MPEQPNILLILTDQQRLSAVGAYGDTPCRTPYIDQLAAEGVRFENAYTTCPVCSPARGTIMTGLYPHSHGITANIHELACSVHELVNRPSLLSRRLEKAGYSLGYTGKWHLGTDQTEIFGGQNQPSLPSNVGFEGHDFPGHGDGGYGTPQFQQYLAENNLPAGLKQWAHNTEPIRRAGELIGGTESSVAHFLAEHTISLIDDFADSDQPFFIWHNFWGPHEPYYAPREFLKWYEDVEIPTWSNYGWDSRSIAGPHHVKIHPQHEQLSWDDWAMQVRYYYATTSLIDYEIGRMVAHLKQNNQLDNTIIIFAADHGETLGSYGGLVDKGWHHFEETHRIPFIMRFPDGLWQGKVIHELVSLADLYPTILDMAQATWQPDTVHGKSLLPLIDGQTDDWREFVVTEFGGLGHLGMTQRTLRFGGLKYGYNAWGDDELYDLVCDPHETRNLIHHPEYADDIRDLRQKLLLWMKQTHDPAERMYHMALSYHDH